MSDARTSDNVKVVVVPSDSLEAENVNLLHEQIESQLDQTSNLVLDLRNVQFMDSAGCSALLAWYRKMRDLGRQFVLCQVTRPVRALFDLIRMNRVIDVFSSPDEAIASLAA